MTLPTVPALLAGIENLIGLLVVVLFMVVPFILRVIGAIAEAGKKPPQGLPQPQPPQAHPPRRPAVGGRPQAGMGQGQRSQPQIDREIEDFLQKARAGRRPPEVEMLDPRGRPRPSRQSHGGWPGREVVVEAEEAIEVAEPVDDRLGSLDDFQRQRRAARQSFAQRLDRLGDEVEDADERMEAHIHEAFDVGHSAGAFGEMPMVGAETSPSLSGAAANLPRGENSSAARIMRLLKTPGGMRQAVVLSEILRRPVGE